MSKPCEPKPVALSGKIYERLLALYPAGHRREYGPPMAQLFRDQCRDAWTEARGWALALLWLRTSTDLLKTSMLEHLRNLKQKKSMFNKIAAATNNADMKANIKRSINVATIIALFLIAMSTSPKAIAQLVVFIALLTVVFGRDLLLKKQSTLSRDEAGA